MLSQSIPPPLCGRANLDLCRQHGQSLLLSGPDGHFFCFGRESRPLQRDGLRASIHWWVNFSKRGVRSPELLFSTTCVRRGGGNRLAASNILLWVVLHTPRNVEPTGTMCALFQNTPHSNITSSKSRHALVTLQISSCSLYTLGLSDEGTRARFDCRPSDSGSVCTLSLQPDQPLASSCSEKVLLFTITACRPFRFYLKCLGETCSNGLPGIDGSTDAGVGVCCPIECGTCGSAVCSSSDPPDASCCPNHIVDSDQGDCADNGAAPCVMTDEGTRRAASELKIVQRQSQVDNYLFGGLGFVSTRNELEDKHARRCLGRCQDDIGGHTD